MTTTPSPTGPAVAVLDFGKTNTKLRVYGSNGALLWQERTRPLWQDAGHYRQLDEDALWQWANQALARAVQAHPQTAHLITTTHGCTFALIGRDGLVEPVIDYESTPPAAVSAEYEGLRDPFAVNASPSLPDGQNIGRGIYWALARSPGVLQRTTAIVGYPQYWGWKFSGRAVGEVSYLGAHTDLWSPVRNDYAPLVDAQGWRDRLPPRLPAGRVIGQYRLPLPGGEHAALQVHNGVHDSNAALAFYRALGHGDCTLVSTGTWVIAFNPACPLAALDPARDMLANVTVDGQAIATARWMGGREFDLLSEGVMVDVDRTDLEAAIVRGQYVVPGFVPGGPFAGCVGGFRGPAPADAVSRAAIIALYLACMTQYMLSLLRSSNRVIVDGGLAGHRWYAPLLAQLQGQPVLSAASAEGTSAGAASLVFAQLGQQPFNDPLQPVPVGGIAGLENYYAHWCAVVHSPPL